MDTALPGVFGREERNALVAELHAIKTSYFERLTEQGSLNLRPGIAPLLLAAQDSGIRLAIASTTSPANIETLLRATLGRDSAEIFDVVSAGDSVPRKKPAPDIYLSALAELALPAAACLALEDSQNGLRAAMAAGIVTVVTPSSFTFDEDFTGASCVVETIADLANGAGRARVGSSILKALREIHARAIQCLRHGVAGG
jgi:HAD superfamily hydrolase (TIGR01509 family)